MKESGANLLDRMEEFGFLEHIYEELPGDFTAVFELARILEDESAGLTAKLAPALKLSAGIQASPENSEPMRDPQTIIPDEDELEAGPIKSPLHMPRMYNRQWLLPDEVLFRKLARRELLAPYPREAGYYPVSPDVDDFAPDGRKQKLYILLDTSSSMALRNRINLAKALVYRVLKRNMRELGVITLRTFDVEVGERREARDKAGFQALIRHVMRLHTLGNGTAMSRAIDRAVRDITQTPQLAGTEILIVTDGACALNEKEIRSMLGDAVVINTVKIGHSRLYASKGYIRDKIFEDDTAQHRIIAELQKKEKEFQRLKDSAQSPGIRRRYEESLSSVRREIERQVNAMTEAIVVGYGHELEKLSSLYLEIDDIDLASLLPDRRYMAVELKKIFDALRAELDEHITPDLIRKLALLSDHLHFLISTLGAAGPGDELAGLRKQAAERLSALVRLETGAPETDAFTRLSSEDRHDLQFLVSVSSMLRFPFWKILGRSFLKWLRRAFSRF